jgi:hypothetical protein
VIAVVIAAIWWAATSFATVVHIATWRDVTPELWISSAIYLAIVLTFATRPPVQAFLRSMPKFHKGLLGLFLFLLLAGHLTERNPSTFPFVSWTMYGRAVTENEVVFIAYDGVTESGRKIPVRPDRYFRFRNGPLTYALDRVIRSVWIKPEPPEEQGEPPAGGGVRAVSRWLRRSFRDHAEATMSLEERKKGVTAVLTAVGRRHNARHPDQKLTAIEIVRGTVNLENPGGEVPRIPLARVDIEQGRLE